MAGPTIIAYGTEAQKQRYLREDPLLRGDLVPGLLRAGRRLGPGRRCSTRAVSDGDDWVVNGQKVWTSLAHMRRLDVLLARTDPDAPKHKGITYFLLDMHAPGVDGAAARQITGDAEFNEVFFDDVRVPESQRAGRGRQGLGGCAAPRSCTSASRSASGCMRLRISLESIIDLARRMEKDGRAVTSDPVMRQKIAQLWIDTEALKYTGARAITKLLKGELPGPEASAGKMAGSRRTRSCKELAMEIEGPYSRAGEGLRSSVDGGFWQYAFLRSRANSIEGGTTEIQKNIIGERVLGLPKGFRGRPPWISDSIRSRSCCGTPRAKFLESECTVRVRPRAHGRAGRASPTPSGPSWPSRAGRGSSIRRSSAAPGSASST